MTLFAPGDSKFAGELVPTVPSGLWNDGFHPDPTEYYTRTNEMVLACATEFDVIHSHTDYYGFELAERSPVPVLSTLHGRTDKDPLARAIREHPGVALIAISEAQRNFMPSGNWVATILHGLDFSATPDYTQSKAAREGDGYLAFVGRLSRGQGDLRDSRAGAPLGTRLRIAAKVLDPSEKDIYESLIEPAIRDGAVEFLGELGERERDVLVGEAFVTIMLSKWPEPFGLVAIESLALGTPIIVGRSGALPEIVVEGIDGFIVDDPVAGAAAVDDVHLLDRARIRSRTLERFSAARMLDDYERVFAQVVNDGIPRPLAQGALSEPM